MGRSLTPKQLLARSLAQRDKDEAYLRRFRARELIFGKGSGHISVLSDTEKKFIWSVEHESYNLYLAEFHGAKPRYQVGASWQRKLRRPHRTEPMSFLMWRRRWYGSQKVRWNRHDLPRIMKERFERLKDERTDSAVR